MKIKANLKVLHRVNPNAILCDINSIEELKDGKIVDVEEKAAKELLNMGFAKQADNKIKKKGVK
mgnify:FL=1|jgi:hypothetical protein